MRPDVIIAIAGLLLANLPGIAPKLRTIILLTSPVPLVASVSYSAIARRRENEVLLGQQREQNQQIQDAWVEHQQRIESMTAQAEEQITETRRQATEELDQLVTQKEQLEKEILEIRAQMLTDKAEFNQSFEADKKTREEQLTKVFRFKEKDYNEAIAGLKSQKQALETAIEVQQRESVAEARRRTSEENVRFNQREAAIAIRQKQLDEDLLDLDRIRTNQLKELEDLKAQLELDFEERELRLLSEIEALKIRLEGEAELSQSLFEVEKQKILAEDTLRLQSEFDDKWDAEAENFNEQLESLRTQLKEELDRTALIHQEEVESLKRSHQATLETMAQKIQALANQKNELIARLEMTQEQLRQARLPEYPGGSVLGASVVRELIRYIYEKGYILDYRGHHLYEDGTGYQVTLAPREGQEIKESRLKQIVQRDYAVLIKAQQVELGFAAGGYMVKVKGHSVDLYQQPIDPASGELSYIAKRFTVPDEDELLKQTSESLKRRDYEERIANYSYDGPLPRPKPDDEILDLEVFMVDYFYFYYAEATGNKKNITSQDALMLKLWGVKPGSSAELLRSRLHLIFDKLGIDYKTKKGDEI